MKDFLLNVQENTFKITNKKFNLTENKLQYLQQKIRAVLSFQQGEYFTDSNIGIPYIPDFDLTKEDHRIIIGATVQEKLMNIDGIKSLVSFDTEYDNSKRQLEISFVVKTDEDEEITYSTTIEA